jgi:hypothetical protein
MVRVLPPLWIVIVYFIILAIWEIFYILYPPSDVKVFSPHLLVAAGGVIAYAGYRVWHFHPMYNQKYKDWLLTLPWSKKHPLPLGPILIAPQDIIIIALLNLVSFLSPSTPVYLVPLIFFGSFTIALNVTLFKTTNMIYTITTLFLYGLFFLIPLTWWAIALVISVIHVVVIFGVRDGLCHLHEKENTSILLYRWKKKEEASQKLLCPMGWPLLQIRPQELIKFSWKGRIIPLLLIGWWTFVLLYKIHGNPKISGELSGCIYILFFILSMFPIGILMDTSPPISFWGRIATGKLIIPRYDKLFLCSFIPVIWLIILYFTIGTRFGLPSFISGPLISILLFLCMFVLSDLYNDWNYTAGHRIQAIRRRIIRPKSKDPAGI